MEHDSLASVGRLPLPGDNVAIAVRRLERGTSVNYAGLEFALDSTVLEGHRFAVAPLEPGEPLLSWGLPFGVATRPIAPGGYVCNAGMLEALRGRTLDFALPETPNFIDEITPYHLDEEGFSPAPPLELYPTSRTFRGYVREGGRGVGTRNYIVLLGTTSQTASYVRALEARLKGAAQPNLSGIVAVAHTEGGGGGQPNNLDLLLRTLAGFMVHPNVGAVLAVDYGSERVTNSMLRSYMTAQGYPLEEVTHRFLSLTGPVGDALDKGEAIVRGWLAEVGRTERRDTPLSELKVALQCGGSDAFSGISGNPLASWVAREIIRYGGAANLAETDELIGAEAYVLQKVRSLDTARRFLSTVERFKERVAWHGTTAEGNPSGGNKLRGLYNIVLKSIGAAMKRHPDVPLDYVIDYGERMHRPGYTFMDSPGNDLESIAGQVASGCTVIFFITGNGSITNFPFVPTVKIVTTTPRFTLLSRDMDVNAGRYLDGTPMDALSAETLDLTLRVASGERSVGERAGHAQVQIWRDWRQTGPHALASLRTERAPQGRPLAVKEPEGRDSAWRFEAVRNGDAYTTDRLGLILPTSLCAGQIARMTAERLNRQGLGRAQGLSRFVALMHTEGCGVSSGSAELYTRTLLGYATHPLVRHCLLLEHGCEMTHNDYMRGALARSGLDPRGLGWASVQADGGIERVMARIEDWFASKLAAEEAPVTAPVGLEHLRLGLLASGPVPEAVARSLATLTRTVIGAGGTVVLPETSSLLASAYAEEALAETPAETPEEPTLAYGQAPTLRGLHLMETPTEHWVETLTGLGATGVELILAFSSDHPQPSHPLVPVLQVMDGASGARYAEDLDLVLEGDAAERADAMLERLVQTASRVYTPRLHARGLSDFQFTRGLLGVSL